MTVSLSGVSGALLLSVAANAFAHPGQMAGIGQRTLDPVRRCMLALAIALRVFIGVVSRRGSQSG